MAVAQGSRPRRWSAGCIHTQEDWYIAQKLIGRFCDDEWLDQANLLDRADTDTDSEKCAVMTNRQGFIDDCAFKAGILLYGQNRWRQFQTARQVPANAHARTHHVHLLTKQSSTQEIYNFCTAIINQATPSSAEPDKRYSSAKICNGITRFIFTRLAESLNVSALSLNGQTVSAPSLWPKSSYGADETYEHILYESKKGFFLEAEYESVRMAILLSNQNVPELIAHVHGMTSLMLDAALHWCRRRVGSCRIRPPDHESAPDMSARARRHTIKACPRPRLMTPTRDTGPPRVSVSSAGARRDTKTMVALSPREESGAIATSRKRLHSPPQKSPRYARSLAQIASDMNHGSISRFREWCPRVLHVLLRGFITFCEPNGGTLPHKESTIYDFKLLEDCCTAVVDSIKACQSGALRQIQDPAYDGVPAECMGWIYDTAVCSEVLGVLIGMLGGRSIVGGSENAVGELAQYLARIASDTRKSCKQSIENMLASPAQLKDMCNVPKTYACPWCSTSYANTTNGTAHMGHIPGYVARGASLLKRQNATVLWRIQLNRAALKNQNGTSVSRRRNYAPPRNAQSEQVTPRRPQRLRHTQSSICLSCHRYGPDTHVNSG